MTHPSGALSRLLGGTGTTEFADAYWGARPLRSAVGDVSDLFSASAVDELIALRGLRAPFLRVAKDGRTFGDREFTSGGGVGAAVGDQLSDDLIWRHFEAGATLVLQALHRTYEPVLRFTQDLAADLGHPCQVNAYITPPQSTGFADHYDVHDVFVVQVEGEKQWRIREPVWPLPLWNQPWDEHKAAIAEATLEDPIEEFVMTPGDVLYVPRGYLHSATALGDVSIHLTIGVHQWTRHHLAEQLVAAALEVLGGEESVRGSLPLGIDVGDAGAISGELAPVRQALADALAEVPDTVVSAKLAKKARGAQRAGPLAPLAQLRGLQDQTERVELRSHLDPDLLDGPLRLVTRLGTLTLRAEDRPDVEKLIETRGPLAVSSDLAARLLRAGVCIPSTL